MSEPASLQGLSCPNCGGMVPIPEGQVIVKCPFCDMRSFVKGDRGLRHFQVQQKAPRETAEKAMQQFLSRNFAIARDASRKAQVSEVFLAYLPFWVVWERMAGWAFGQVRVGSGDHAHHEPREIKIVEENTWDGAACDTGEFGVNEVPLTTQALEPFNPDKLHASGMVFEPVNSFSDAKAAAQASTEAKVRSKANLDRISQLFVRSFRQRFGLVYYPLWIIRYLYRGRAFQVVVDGYTGQVLYGKAPGNTLYRAAMLVGGMALGAFLAVDASSFVLSQSSHDQNGGLFGLALIAVGFGIMAIAYRAFRYGEQFEYRFGRSGLPGIGQAADILSTAKDVGQWLNRLS
jgi:hypothetical protein